jgi:hypothetical protein
MGPQEILVTYDQQQRVAYEYPDMHKEVLPHVTRHLRPAPGLSLILHSQLDESNADQVIQEQIDDFTRLKLPFSCGAARLCRSSAEAAAIQRSWRPDCRRRSGEAIGSWWSMQSP